MARSFMDLAAGPRRMGAVSGFVLAGTLALLLEWFSSGFDNLYPLYAFVLVGPGGAIVGFLLACLIAGQRTPAEAQAERILRTARKNPTRGPSMEWAVGPLTPRRIGAVVGTVSGIVAILLSAWIENWSWPPGPPSWMVGLAIMFVGVPFGLLWGSIVGALIGRRIPQPPVPA